MKNYKPEEINEQIPQMFEQLHQFFAHDQISYASKVIIPPLMKELKENRPASFTAKQLEPYHKDLVCVGYSLSYLDAIPQLLQTRVIQGKDVMYAQLTVGIKAVEVSIFCFSEKLGYLWLDFARQARSSFAGISESISFLLFLMD